MSFAQDVGSSFSERQLVAFVFLIHFQKGSEGVIVLGTKC